MRAHWESHLVPSHAAPYPGVQLVLSAGTGGIHVHSPRPFLPDTVNSDCDSVIGTKGIEKQRVQV